MSRQIALKVFSYNIHKGFAVGNWSFVLPAMRDAIVALEPDIVFLQEVLGKHERHARRVQEWPAEPQPEFMAQGIWPHVAYGKNAVYSHGHHGNAILSKYPIRSYENIDVSTNAFEARGILHAVIDVPGVPVPVHCMCVHLNMLKTGRETQLKQLCKRVIRSVSHGEPVIVAGDFNDWQENASKLLFDDVGLHEVFLHLHGEHAPTFPTVYPLLRLDRVYARGFSAVDGEILIGDPWSSLSDHAPLYAKLLISV